MADLGSIAALKADIDAKVTTNGANENTGARVNTSLNNMVDTLNALNFVDVESTAGPGLSIIETGAGTTNVELKRIVAGTGIGVYADTGGIRIENEGTIALRTGSTIAFDTPAAYNTPSTPTNSAVTFDLSGAVNCEVVAYFDNAAEPTWPANVYNTGLWNNGALNTVRFIYIDASNIGAEINSNNFTGNLGRWNTVVKTATTTRTSTATLAADPDLVVAMVANKSYRVRGTVVLLTNATPDFKYRFTGPASPSAVRIRATHVTGSGTAPTDYFEAAYSAADKVFLVAVTALGHIEFDIYISNGANAGNFAFEWAQNTSDAANTSVWIGSYFDYMQVN